MLTQSLTEETTDGNRITMYLLHSSDIMNDVVKCVSVL